MKKFSLLQSKLNSEKGITGVDIVVSITMIILSISVIMAVYVNVSNAVNSTNRNAGATKMVTNIAENIKLAYYDELEAEFDSFRTNLHYTCTYKPYDIDAATGKTIYNGSDYEYNGVYKFKHNNTYTSYEVLDTKIPRGYDLTIEVQNVMSQPESASEKIGYNLIKEFDITVSYKVAGEEKDVSINVIKAIENLETEEALANKPVFGNTDYICATGGVSFDKLAHLERINNSTFKVVAEPTYKYYGAASEYKPCYVWLGTDSKNEGDTITYNPLSTDISIKENSKNIFIWIPAHNINDSNVEYKYKKTKFWAAKIELEDELKNTGETNPKMSIYTVYDKDHFDDTNFLINKAYDGIFANVDKVDELEGIWVRLADLNGMNRSKNYNKYVLTYVKDFLNVNF